MSLSVLYFVLYDAFRLNMIHFGLCGILCGIFYSGNDVTEEPAYLIIQALCGVVNFIFWISLGVSESSISLKLICRFNPKSKRAYSLLFSVYRTQCKSKERLLPSSMLHFVINIDSSRNGTHLSNCSRRRQIANYHETRFTIGLVVIASSH